MLVRTLFSLISVRILYGYISIVLTLYYRFSLLLNYCLSFTLAHYLCAMHMKGIMEE
jgi:hypothetical protein